MYLSSIFSFLDKSETPTLLFSIVFFSLCFNLIFNFSMEQTVRTQVAKLFYVLKHVRTAYEVRHALW